MEFKFIFTKSTFNHSTSYVDARNLKPDISSIIISDLGAINPFLFKEINLSQEFSNQADLILSDKNGQIHSFKCHILSIGPGSKDLLLANPFSQIYATDNHHPPHGNGNGHSDFGDNDSYNYG